MLPGGLLAPATPSPTFGSAQPSEKPWLNKASTRTCEDALEWAMGEGIGEVGNYEVIVGFSQSPLA